LIFLFIIGCTIKNPVSDEWFSPFLSNLMIPEAVYLKSDIVYPISVKVSDPQGLDDINTVKYLIYSEGVNTPVLEDTLTDDGKKGDIIPYDGIYYDTLNVSFSNGTPGEYIIKVLAEDYENNLSNTIYDTLYIVDDEKNLPPKIFNPIVPDTLTENTIEDVFLSIQVNEPQGLDDIDSVFFRIYPSFSAIYLYSWKLNDDGVSGDITAGDGIFSFWGNLFYNLRINGEYLIRFQAVDKKGSKSNIIVENFYIQRPNDSPVLLEIDAPDVVGLSAGHFTVSIKVNDLQGPEDIKRVYFNSTKPDGQPAGGNPFYMYDDGDEKHGDNEEGDGWYSLEVEITKQNEPGDYKFEFFAEDQAGVTSKSINHTITVILD
jgi:hypothetical protein